MILKKPLSEPEPKPETISKEEFDAPGPEIKTASTDIEKISDRVVKVQFVEYTGKRKKKVTHIEVKEAELEEILKSGEKLGQAQFALF
jgi:hypothetical protein